MLLADQGHGRRRKPAVAAGNSQADEVDAALQVGTRVRVKQEGLKLFNAPKKAGIPFDPVGLSGEVVKIIDAEGLTPNRPVLVKLTIHLDGAESKPKFFNAHFEPEELCICPETCREPTAGALAGAPAPANAVKDDDRWQVNLLYDGDCPSCMKQVEFLQKRMLENPEYAGIVRLTDLTAPDYSPEQCGGVDFEDGMRHIHAVTRDGEVIVGMQVFRRIYSYVGMEWVHTVTTLPVVGGFVDWLYDLWAEYRLQITGRSDAIEKIRARRQRIEELSTAECDTECEIDWGS